MKEWQYPRQKQFEKQLRQSAENWFRSKGFETQPKMPYCLNSLEDWANNIILPEVTKFIQDCKAKAESEGRPYPLHKYVHHGLSSQAMAFNLFGPLITRQDLTPFVELLVEKRIKVQEDIVLAEFEYEDRKIFCENQGQPTSIDIVLKNSQNKPVVFIESKLVEKEFGGCSVFAGGDCPGMNPAKNLEECYHHFIGRKYWTIMEKHGISDFIKNEKTCPFTSYYQFFREILFSIENNGPFILLCDKRSAVFQVSEKRGLVPFLRTFLPNELKYSLDIVTIQEVVDKIRQSNRHNDWIGEFCIKYGIR